MAFTIAGVPEHFNYPWHRFIREKGGFIENPPLTWQDFPGGTGAMLEALEKDHVQMALLLTEGAVAAMSKGTDIQIISPYVISPLVWGIHVPAKSSIETINDIQGRKYAISRYGSGSHLMAFVDANERGWPTENLQFELIQNLDGARQSFAKGESEVFLWEKFTTKPYVVSGEFRRVGERPTPWPCFMLVAKSAFIQEQQAFIKKLLEGLFSMIEAAEKDPQLIQHIAGMYNLPEEDIHSWKQTTEWAKSTQLQRAELDAVSDYLFKLKLIDQKLPADQLCSSFVTLS